MIARIHNTSCVLMATVIAAALCAGARAQDDAHAGNDAIPPALHERITQALHTAEWTWNDQPPTVAPNDVLIMAAEINNSAVILALHPATVCAANFRLRVQTTGGEIDSIAPLPSHPETYRGEIIGDPGAGAGAGVAASMIDGRFAALIRTAEGELWAMQSADTLVADAPPGMRITYRATDALVPPGLCGTITNIGNVNLAIHSGGGSGEGGIDGLTHAIIAFDADVEFYQLNNSSVPNTVADIEGILNAINVIYEPQVGITYAISDILVRTAEPDPYFSTNASVLLGQFQLEWNTNQYFISRDVAHLMTGKLTNNNIVGLANIGKICSFPMESYSLAQSRWTPVYAARVTTSAHELGHNWNALHCNGQPDCGIMCATVGACPGGLSTFGVLERTQITTYRDSVTCFAAPIPPPNDSCTNAFTVMSGPTPIRTTNATTDGPDEPSCNFGASSQVEHDVWFTWTSPCTGLATMGVCDADFDARLAVYAGCPAAPGNVLACDDHACNSPGGGGSGGGPQVVFHVTAATDYRIRIGSASAMSTGGTGTLSVACQTEPANNVCSAAISALTGATNFSTVLATTDGPDEPGLCNINGSTQLNNDVWFKYLATCGGTVTVGLCGSTFDAKLAIYAGGCPTGPGSAIACNDDFCGVSPQVTFSAPAAALYRIRIGAAVAGTTGTGTMVITCAPPPPPPECIADIDHDGVVNSADLQIVLATWGACATTPGPPACPADLNVSGTVDMDDLLAVINAWGGCA